MSRNFIPCLGLVLGAAMIAGTPALATGTITEAAVPQLAAATSGISPIGSRNSGRPARSWPTPISMPAWMVRA